MSKNVVVITAIECFKEKKGKEGEVCLDSSSAKNKVFFDRLGYEILSLEENRAQIAFYHLVIGKKNKYFAKKITIVPGKTVSAHYPIQGIRSYYVEAAIMSKEEYDDRLKEKRKLAVMSLDERLRYLGAKELKGYHLLVNESTLISEFPYAPKESRISYQQEIIEGYQWQPRISKDGPSLKIEKIEDDKVTMNGITIAPDQSFFREYSGRGYSPEGPYNYVLDIVITLEKES